MNEGFQVDYLAVGEASKSGDAIALRFGNLYGPREQQSVIIIDGGSEDSGRRLVEHIKAYYNTDVVDTVIATHPDSDHVSGLSEVLEGLTVRQLAMHLPWNYSDEIKSVLTSPYLLHRFNREVKKSYAQAYDLHKLALDKKVPSIIEPFAGDTGFNERLLILGPSRDYYQSLVPHIKATKSSVLPRPPQSTLAQAISSISRSIETVYEDMNIETLTDDSPYFHPSNKSSAIILLSVGGKKILFTGDADIEALTHAADLAEAGGLALNDLHLLHVPHHGSKNNVGPTILDRIKTQKAQVSAAAASDKHPSQRVINALIRRDATVYTTAGKGIVHHHNAPARDGWSSAAQQPFLNQFSD